MDITILITYFVDDSEAYVTLFKSDDEAIESVLENIRHNFSDDNDEDGNLDEFVAEASKSLKENGWWKDYDDTVYSLKQQRL